MATGFFGGMTPETMGLLGAAAGLLNAAGPSRIPVSTGQALGQGLLGGIGMFQQGVNLQDQSELRKLQRTKLEADLEAARKQREALSGLAGFFAPQQAPGLSQSSANAINASWAASPGVQMPGQIPNAALAQAAAAGVDIIPFLKLNEASLPNTEQVDAGNEILIRDKRTQQVLQRIPKGAAPASVPFEASDLAPPAYRDFILNRNRAGATNVQNNVNTFVPFNEQLQGDMAKQLVKNFETLQSIPDQLATLERAKEAAIKAVPFVGSGADAKLEVVKFLNNNLGTSIAPEQVKNAELFRSAGFRMVLDNLKKMDAQPSEAQQAALQKAMGRLDTDPAALPEVIDITRDILISRAKEHNRRVEEAKKNKATFMYDITIPLPKEGGQPSRSVVRRGTAPDGRRVIQYSDGSVEYE